MADFILGELLLSDTRLRLLTWDALDCLLAGQQVVREKDMVPFRMLATQIYNLMPGDEGVMTEAQYLPLYALGDAPRKGKPVMVETPEQYRDRLAAQNAQTLAARAAIATD